MPDLLNLMVDSGAADLHVRVGIPPCYRDGGTLKRVEGPPCEQEDVEYLVKAIANDDEVQISEPKVVRTSGSLLALRRDFGSRLLRSAVTWHWCCGRFPMSCYHSM